MLMSVALHVVLDQPEIPGNTGNIIRLAAVAGFRLHIAGPTLFEFSDTRLKRAGLDYHDLAVMTEHAHLEDAYTALGLPDGDAGGPATPTQHTSGAPQGDAGSAIPTQHAAGAPDRNAGEPAIPTQAPRASSGSVAEANGTRRSSSTPRVFAFTGDGEIHHTEVDYRPGDVLLFGRESTGLDEHVKQDPRVTARVQIPMLPGRRSLNLANSVSVAVYEAWRQAGFRGGV